MIKKLYNIILKKVMKNMNNCMSKTSNTSILESPTCTTNACNLVVGETRVIIINDLTRRWVTVFDIHGHDKYLFYYTHSETFVKLFNEN